MVAQGRVFTLLGWLPEFALFIHVLLMSLSLSARVVLGDALLLASMGMRIESNSVHYVVDVLLISSADVSWQLGACLPI